MGKITLGVAIVGIATSVALAVRSQIRDDRSAPAGTAGARAPSAAAAASDRSEPVATPAATSRHPSASVYQDTSTKQRPQAPKQQPVPKQQEPVVPVRAPHPPLVENAENFQVPDAASILTRAATAYSRIQSSRADFLLRRTNPLLGSTTTSRGKVYQKRPDRFLMKFSDPAGDVIVSDAHYFWIYYPSADPRQVLRAPASQGAAGGVDLQAQFLGDPLRRFSNTFHGIDTIAGRKAYVLTLVPRSDLGYRSLKVWIDTKDYLTRRFILTESNGVVQDFTLSNLVLNPALGNDLFRFSPPPNARIVERS